MTGHGRTRHIVLLVGFGLALVLAWLCYRPGFHGDFRLDDRSNLEGLSNVAAGGSVVAFVLSGDAGPTGRPLALASFALQAGHWEEGPAAFLEVNRLIHLVNAGLLACCLYLLASQSSVGKDRALLAAVLSAAAWVLLPLNASATLLVVQRMTTLSALFVLLGLAGYLLARTRLERRPVAALAGMSTSLILGTVFATLSKESGLLLPVFALVLEATVLERPRSLKPRSWHLWKGVFLLLPLLALGWYLSTLLDYTDSLELRRGFGPFERLFTEARILWLYVAKAIVGLPWTLGIYQTPPEISRSLFEPLTLAAASAWVGLLAAAVVLRRRFPLFALAVLWFLAAHLIESTVVPLEVYFEHRNYLATAIPVFAIVAALARGPVAVQRYGIAVLAVVLVANAFFLYTFASIWGEPSTSSRYWAMRYPDSPRAVTTMASYQLTEEGPLAALRTIDRFAIENPGSAYLRIQELNLRCLTAPAGDHDAVLDQLRAELPGVDFTYTAGRMLSQLLDTAAAVDCRGVSPARVAEVAGWLRQNPRYSGDGSYNRFHYRLLAAIARLQGDMGSALDYLRQAMRYGRTPELNMMMVTGLVATGDFDAALEFIEDARGRLPRNVARALNWQRDLDELEAYVLEVRAQDRDNTPGPDGEVPEDGAL